MKRCTKCKEIKSETDFYYENASQCKDCLKRYQREKYQASYPFRKYKKHKNMPPSNTSEYQKEWQRRKMTPEKRQHFEQLEYLRKHNLRQCYKCENIKPIKYFAKISFIKGYKYICKECHREYYKEWYKSHGRSRNKKAQKAEWKVNKAKKNGTLIKPEKCEICGEKNDIRAHHEDYNKPLEVIWVCRKCHKKLHEKIMV